jgi:hypothetical protein
MHIRLPFELSHDLVSQWGGRVSGASGIDVTTPDTAEITGPTLTRVFG